MAWPETETERPPALTNADGYGAVNVSFRLTSYVINQRRELERLSNIVDCLNQAAHFLTPFSNLIPADTSAVNAGLGRPHKLWPWRRG